MAGQKICRYYGIVIVMLTLIASLSVAGCVSSENAPAETPTTSATLAPALQTVEAQLNSSESLAYACFFSIARIDLTLVSKRTFVLAAPVWYPSGTGLV